MNVRRGGRGLEGIDGAPATAPPGGADPTAGLAASGEVLVVVLRGQIAVLRAGTRQVLREGDVVHFAAREAGGMSCEGEIAARVLWVCSPPAAL